MFSQAKLKKELSSFMKGLDFSVAAPEAEDGEEELNEFETEEEGEEEEEEQEEEDEEDPDEDQAEESEDNEDADMSISEPVADLKAKAVRQPPPEIEGFVKKSGLSAVQPSSNASIFVSHEIG